MSYKAVLIDGKPNFVYVLIASRGIERPVVIRRALITLRAALAHYGQRQGMVIVDRDGAAVAPKQWPLGSTFK